MTMVRRYIKPFNFKLRDNDEYKQTIKQFFKDVEQLFLDAGFVKSNVPDNMDTDNPTIPESTNDWNLTNYLYFDLNDSMQSELPVRIGISAGCYTTNGSDTRTAIVNFCHYVYGIVHENNEIKNKAYFRSFVDNHANYDYSRRGGNVIDNQLDSFIINNEGFVSINLCNGYGCSGHPDAKPFSCLGSLTIERSFDVSEGGGVFTLRKI